MIVCVRVSVRIFITRDTSESFKFSPTWSPFFLTFQWIFLVGNYCLQPALIVLTISSIQRYLIVASCIYSIQLALLHKFGCIYRVQSCCYNQAAKYFVCVPIFQHCSIFDYKPFLFLVHFQTKLIWLDGQAGACTLCDRSLLVVRWLFSSVNVPLPSPIKREKYECDFFFFFFQYVKRNGR